MFFISLQDINNFKVHFYDFAYNAVETKVLARGEALVPTDLSISISNGTYARIAPRSVLAWKHSIDVGAAEDLLFEFPLKEYPDPILRAKNKSINTFDDTLKKIADEMFDIMHKYDIYFCQLRYENEGISGHKSILLIAKQHHEKLNSGYVDNVNGGAQLIPGNAGLLGMNFRGGRAIHSCN